MSGRLDGRVALVTGGGSGIGRATAVMFAAEGAAVAIADVDTDGGEETATLVEQQGGRCVFVRCDVSQAAEVEALVARAVEFLGGLDVAFNCAGIAGDLGATGDCNEDNWDRTIATNLKGVWLCMRAEINAMLTRGGGSIVNAASVAGLVGYPGLPAYSAAKGGVVQLTRTAAVEYAAAGIRVNVVCPGAIRTPMLEDLVAKHPELEAGLLALHPIGRIGEPDEIAHAVVFLASDDAAFITGQALPIDGGWTVP